MWYTTLVQVNTILSLQYCSYPELDAQRFLMTRRPTQPVVKDKSPKRAATARNANIATERIVMEPPVKAEVSNLDQLKKIVHIPLEIMDEVSQSDQTVCEQSRVKPLYEMTYEELSAYAEKHTRKEVVHGDNSVAITPLTDEEAKKVWSKIVVPRDPNDPYYQFYTLLETAKILKIDLLIVKKWIKSGKIIGFKYKSNKLGVPKEQIRDGKLAPGLEKLSEFFSSADMLWAYLTRIQYVRNERLRPLELHFQNRLELAVSNAAGYGMSFL